MAHITMREAEAHMADYVQRASAGETIVITRHGNPVAELTKPDVKKFSSHKKLRDEIAKNLLNQTSLTHAVSSPAASDNTVLEIRDDQRY